MKMDKEIVITVFSIIAYFTLRYNILSSQADNNKISIYVHISTMKVELYFENNPVNRFKWQQHKLQHK